MPHREVMDGVLVIFGGAFLITPGFITDVIGLLLLVPPTRALIRSLVVRRLGRRVTVGVVSRPGRSRRAQPAATTTSRARATRVRRRAAQGSSGERTGARAVLLRRRPRHPRNGAVGHDDPVRGQEAERARRRVPRSRRPAPAGGLSCRTGSRSSSSRCRRLRSSAACAPTWRGSAARRAGARSTASARSRETEVPPQWEELDALRSVSALVDEQHALLALARRPRGAVGHGDEEVTARLVEDDARAARSRPPASRPSTTEAAASAAPASSCGCPTRTIRAAARAS